MRGGGAKQTPNGSYLGPKQFLILHIIYIYVIYVRYYVVLALLYHIILHYMISPICGSPANSRPSPWASCIWIYGNHMSHDLDHDFRPATCGDGNELKLYSTNPPGAARSLQSFIRMNRTGAWHGENPPMTGNGLEHLFTVIWGMVYDYCTPHSSVNGGFVRTKWVIFQQAMFDYQRVSLF